MTASAPIGPVFIVGNARSGSTLLRHMLNRSPAIAIAPETHFLRRVRRLRLSGQLAGSPTAADAARVVAALYAEDAQSRTGYWPWLRKHVPQADFVARFERTDRSLAALFRLMIETFAARRPDPGAVRLIGEKSPEHVTDVERLAAWYPGSAFIHTLRDPRAIYASELRRRREGRWGVKQRRLPVPELVVDLALAPMQLLHTAAAWRRADRLDARYRLALGPRYQLVRYEDLVREPASTLERICEGLGVAYDPAMLEVDTIGSSFADARHAGTGLDPAAIDRWRQHVGSVAQAWFRLTLGREMRQRGYR
ncbi:MAG TPA: sulfotransferase [Candidatus Limnocylindria bacterium]